MKLALTAYEADQLATARGILAELNANLASRGVAVTFTVTTAEDGVLADMDGAILVLDAGNAATA